MKVALALGCLSDRSGGMAVTVPTLAVHLRTRGVEPALFGATDPEDPTWVSRLQIAARSAVQWGPVGFGFTPRLGAELRRWAAELLHVNGLWTYASVASLRWTRSCGRPHLVSPRGMLEPWALRRSVWKKRLALLLFERANLRGARCLHALCEGEARSIRALGLTNPIACVSNGVDLPDLAEPLSRGQSRTVLFLGRIDPKKGVHELVRGWKLAGAERAGWKLRIIGWGEPGYVEAARRLVRELDLAPSVELPGPAFGLAKDAAFRAADAFILPSYSEGLPMAALEAWSYALPVLMTSACNLPEGFARGAALEIGTEPERIAAGIRSLMAMPESERLAMGTAGRRLVEERFTWPEVARQMVEVYRWVLGGGSPPACVESARPSS